MSGHGEIQQPSPDKREIVQDCLNDRQTSADAILNALHQGGWAIVPKQEIARLREFAFGDAPEWEKANATVKHRVRELEAENEELREALCELWRAFEEGDSCCDADEARFLSALAEARGLAPYTPEPVDEHGF